MSDALGFTLIVIAALFVGAIAGAAFNDVFGRKDDEDE